jgi:hypothetical protein
MMTGLTDDDLTHQVGALRLGVEAITDPRRYADLRKAVAG